MNILAASLATSVPNSLIAHSFQNSIDVKLLFQENSANADNWGEISFVLQWIPKIPVIP